MRLVSGSQFRGPAGGSKVVGEDWDKVGAENGESQIQV